MLGAIIDIYDSIRRFAVYRFTFQKIVNLIITETQYCFVRQARVQTLKIRCRCFADYFFRCAEFSSQRPNLALV